MEKKNGGFKGFFVTLAVILFSVVSFIIKIFINSTPIEDFPSFTPIVIGTIFVASIGYLIYAMFFGTDSFYRKKRLENRAKREEELKRTHEGKTLKEIYEKEDKKERVKINKKTNWTLISLIIFILLCVLGGSFYWFEYRPTEIKKNCSYTTFTIPEVQAISKEEAESSKSKNESCKEQSDTILNEVLPNLSGYDKWRRQQSDDLDAIDRWIVEEECDRRYPIKEETEYQPQKEGRKDATEKEYNDCLRRNGLL
ncbi:hypothetical protein GX656_03430 [Candidatus Dojkabacteria bacterium]|uniref:Uncharacterized protein n=1 Tax=Candidatus Dojkabacteria bacterium TaxID=2099670 RepID=A0A847D0D4_9BACT|nr:hypothetical protein [Candidatus Dojkabacteria bacterium]